MAQTSMIAMALLVAYASAQIPIPGVFNVPSTPFNRGGRINFTGLSLGQVCKQIMMRGGKEALSDGMGAAAKWFSNQKIPVQVAGGTDPQMQCLYSQATGSMMPGMIGSKDPGNIFGDYYDTVIEYPMILDPCTAPQCNGKVNPTVLLMQNYAPMMRGMGGMGGMSAMGGAMGGGMRNPFGTMAQNPLMSALMPQAGVNPMNAATANGTQVNTAATLPSTSAVATPTAVSPATNTAQLSPNNPMASMFQNPQMMQMMQQLFMQNMMKNMGQATPTAGNPAAMQPVNPMAGFPGMSGMPLQGMGGLQSFFL